MMHLLVINVIIILILLIIACVLTISDNYHVTNHEVMIDEFYKKHLRRFADPVVKRFYHNKDSYFIKRSLQRFLEQVSKGREYCKQYSVVITGLLRDCRHNIPFVKHYFRQMSSMFANVLMVIVENDSTDGSRADLLAWAEEDDRVVILCDNNMFVNQPTCRIQQFASSVMNNNATPDRIERLAYLRNIYLDYIRNHEWLQTFDYMMVLDLDLKGHIFDDGIFHTMCMFEENPTINAISCNGIIYRLGETLIYYDSFAYVEPNATYIWDTIEQKSRHDRYVNKIISKRYQDTIDLDLVFSAFGGLCVYRMNVILNKNFQYDYSRDGFACEHSFFNKHIPNMYVNPRLVFLIMNNH
jgi:hypothetical protein